MKHLLPIFFLLIFYCPTVAQERVETASNRAEKATASFKHSADLGKESLPLKLFKQAKAVAVVPNVTEVNMFLNRLSKGRGLMMMRNSTGWTIPTFMSFASTGYELKIAAKKNFDIIFLFMDDKAIELLKKGDIKPEKITGGKFALGPVVDGKGTDLTLLKASVLYYTLEDGKLSNETFSNDAFFNGVVLSHDNIMNKTIYKKKAQTIFSESADDIKSAPEIEDFKKAVITTDAEISPSTY